jgi:hypothetical protein
MNNTFEMYDDVNHMPLRVYNRAVYLTNLVEDSGKDAGEKYISQFDEGSKRQMYLMLAYIKQKGIEVAKKEVMRGLEIVGD